MTPQRLVQFQPRNDYRELQQLSLAFIRTNFEGHVHIHRPTHGAIHRAMCIEKLIYSLKRFIFRNVNYLRLECSVSSLSMCILKVWYALGNTVSPHEVIITLYATCSATRT